MCNYDCAFFYFGTKQMQGIHINAEFKVAYDAFERTKRSMRQYQTIKGMFHLNAIHIHYRILYALKY